MEVYDDFRAERQPFTFVHLKLMTSEDDRILCEQIGEYKERRYLLIGTANGMVVLMDTELWKHEELEVAECAVVGLVTDHFNNSPDFIVEDENHEYYLVDYEARRVEELYGSGSQKVCHYIFFYFNTQANTTQIATVCAAQLETLKEKKLIEELKNLTVSKDALEIKTKLPGIADSGRAECFQEVGSLIIYANAEGTVYFYDIARMAPVNIRLNKDLVLRNLEVPFPDLKVQMSANSYLNSGKFVLSLEKYIFLCNYDSSTDSGTVSVSAVINIDELYEANGIFEECITRKTVIVYDSCYFIRDTILVLTSFHILMLSAIGHKILLKMCHEHHKIVNERRTEKLFGIKYQLFNKSCTRYFGNEQSITYPIASIVLIMSGLLYVGHPISYYEKSILMFRCLLNNQISEEAISVSSEGTFPTEEVFKDKNNRILKVINEIYGVGLKYQEELGDNQLLSEVNELVIFLLNRNMIKESITLLNSLIKSQKGLDKTEYIKEFIPSYASRGVLSYLIELIPDPDDANALPRHVYYEMIDSLILNDYQSLLLIIKKWKIVTENNQYQQKLIIQLKQILFNSKKGNQNTQRLNVQYIKQTLMYLYNETKEYDENLPLLLEFYDAENLLNYCIEHGLYKRIFEIISEQKLSLDIEQYTQLIQQLCEKEENSPEIIQIILGAILNQYVATQELDYNGISSCVINCLQQFENSKFGDISDKNMIEYILEHRLDIMQNPQLQSVFYRLKLLFAYLLCLALYQNNFLSTMIISNANLIVLLYVINDCDVNNAVELIVNNMEYESGMGHQKYEQYYDYNILKYYFNNFYVYFDEDPLINKEVQEKFLLEMAEASGAAFLSRSMSGKAAEQPGEEEETFFSSAFFPYLVQSHNIILDVLLNGRKMTNIEEQLLRITRKYQDCNINPSALILNYLYYHNMAFISGALIASVLKTILGDTNKATQTIEALVPQLREMIPIDELLQTGVGIEMLYNLRQNHSYLEAENAVLNSGEAERFRRRHTMLNEGLSVECGQVCSGCGNPIDFQAIGHGSRVYIYFCGHCYHEPCEVELQKKTEISSDLSVCCLCFDQKHRERLLNEGMGWWLDLLD